MPWLDAIAMLEENLEGADSAINTITEKQHHIDSEIDTALY